MKRITAGTFLALLVLALSSVLLPAVASAAPVQEDPDVCFPDPDSDYPPASAVELELQLRLVSGQFNPGARGTIVIEGAIPNLTYCGILFSTPVTLPETADAQGRLRYNVAVPADFELNAMHHIDMYRQQRLVGAFDFCVNKTGAIAPVSSCGKKDMSKGGNLARTGSDLWLYVQLAIGAVGVGAGALYLRRRQERARA